MEWIAGAALLAGTSAMALAALGLLRMPDALSRIVAAGLANTIGIAGIFFAAALHFAEPSITGRAMFGVVIVLLTGPISSYRLMRAGRMLAKKRDLE